MVDTEFMRPIDERGNINLIASRMVGFITHLRLNDFALGPAETELALRVIGGAVLTIQEARQTLKILLTSQHTEWQQFDDLFEAYWLQHGIERKRWQASDNTQKKHKTPLPKAWEAHLAGDSFKRGHQPQIETEGEQSVAGDATGRLISTDKTSLFKTDLRQFVSPDEIRDAEKLALKLAKAIRYRLSRRHRIAARGNRLDLRRTIHRSLSTGGEPLSLDYRTRPDKPVRLVIFLDVSGSMKQYSRFFLQFIKGIISQWVEADAYLFHTRLVRVTDALREKDSMKAMTRLSLMAEGFGGGT
ncbi:MAG: VWA domain-containing protein, partial [Sneathiella sp.]